VVCRPALGVRSSIVSFASLNSPQVEDVVLRFSRSNAVTLIVGAGVSMEASLPSWPALIERLLRRVAATNPKLTDGSARAEWTKRTLERDDLLAAGAIVEVLAKDTLDTLLPEELYGAEGPGSFEPGPTAHQVAYLRRCFGAQLTMLTTNYDDLLERALLAADYSKRDVRSYVRRRKVPASAVPVTHLHGFAGRDGPPRQLVLTEEQYQRMQRRTSWQEQCVTDQLARTLCLFVGTSLTDPNLIRYLYGYKKAEARPHAAIFVRQGDAEGAEEDEVRAAREDAVARRWARCGVEAVFVDHFADAAQLVYEIGRAREAGNAYEPVGARAARALSRISEVALLKDAGQAAFAQRQVELSRWLRETLNLTLRSALGTDPPSREPLALALWLLSEDGRRITGWAHSDRAHQDPTTIESVPLRADSTWVAVRSVCRGVRVDQDRESDVSRWRFIRALPLVIDRPTRLPIGCLTIASTRTRARSVLATIPSDAQAILHRGLVEAIRPELARVAASA
jgi:hypothetical protein